MNEEERQSVVKDINDQILKDIGTFGDLVEIAR